MCPGRLGRLRTGLGWAGVWSGEADRDGKIKQKGEHGTRGEGMSENGSKRKENQFLPSHLGFP